ncbi:ectoine/hydroxyectoine ABC transporter ATP-binding protein EhuA [Rhodococcus erythropolis]|uniref:Ectoine/hydroxyectoine ABC transporter ATP-binding protein EhuA n=1 Tax=Rhodococcus erythropolis TaxID=1833 RepID=A0A5N5DWY9_RHOER|nr:ectoine/hydroxyectoine ABC transporter ATP-binding protein EhuA [Rhodococcus erythropolis]
MMNPHLRINKLTKRFAETVVLSDFTLDVGRGEVVSLIGPSGSGKSTLLRCISQIEHADSGFVMLDGELLGLTMSNGRLKAAGREKVRNQRAEVGMVFQNFELFPHMTVLQNIIEAPVHVRKISLFSAQEQARNLLDRVGLENKEHSYPAELSGGQKQRVAIARALAMQPKVILFDEPTSALDPELVGEVLSVIKGLSNSGITLVVATHEISFAREISDTVAFLDGGILIEHGPPEIVINNPSNPRTQEFLSRILPI